MKSDLVKFLSENSKKETVNSKAQNSGENLDDFNNYIEEEGEEEELAINHEEQVLEEKGKDYILLAPDNLPPSILIDVKYDGKNKQAYVKLYNPEDDKVYRWYDKTNHLPYLLTTLSKANVEALIKNKEEFIGCEIVKKHDLLNDKTINLTKVLATNPLAIGGRQNSYRDILSPSFEANIRYHLNYIYDRQLVPGTYYTIQNGKLISEVPKIRREVQEGILAIFKGQSPEIAELVKQYMPLFFAPIPNIKRCSVDIEIHSEPNKIPDPNAAVEKVISIGISDTDGETCVYVLNEGGKSIDKNKATSNFVEFKNETDLLKAVFKKMGEYPIVITFNGDNFDFLYLDNRAKKLKIEDSLIPFIRTKSQDVYLSHAVHIDLYRFFRQPAMRIYAFGGAYERVTLDELGKSLLGKEKIKLDKYIWDLDLEDLIKYNAQDAEITLELTTFSKNQAIELIFMLSRITKMPIDDFTRSSVSIWVQNWMYFEHRFRNYLIPRREDILRLKGDASTEAIIKGKKYQGAIVIEPQVGVWWDVSVLDFACFSEDTEILTDDGWYSLDQLKKKKNCPPKIATVNTTTNDIEFQNHQKIFEYDYEGEMYKFNIKGALDLLVTPNHRMVFNRRTEERRKTRWREEMELTEAQELSKRSWFRIPNFGTWIGKSESITIGNNIFSPEEFLPFLGWFLTDGSFGQRSVIIHQSKTKNFKHIRNSLSKLEMPFKENVYKKQGKNHRTFQINNVTFTNQFKKWLIEENGLVKENDSFKKRIPRIILGFEKIHLKLLFDSMILGDGSWLRNKCYSLSSVYKELANDFQELVLRIGYGCSISEEIRYCSIFGKEYINHKSYRCFINYTRKNVFNNQHDRIQKENHKGRVWCVSVPNGTVVTRRNGKPAVTGNSLYPSIIKTRNLSYETINCNHVECKQNIIPETSHWVCSKNVGISSMLVGFIRDIRVYWFKDRAKDPNLSESERNQSDVIQSSLKVILNANYGVFGSDNFALYCPPVAESTAALAREAISKTKKYCEQKLGLRVLYGDTDSIFVLQPTKSDIEELEDWSMKTFQIELGTDYVFRYCGLSDRKKNYFGITTTGKPIVKGLMGKKKNTPLLAKRPFEEALETLSEVNNPEELEIAKKKIIKIIQKVVREISKKEFILEDLAITVTLSKKLEQYDSWTQPLQAAIQLITAFPEGEKPSVGSFVSFIKTKPFKIQANDTKLSDKISKSYECSVKPLQLATKTDVDIPKVKELLKSTLVQLLDTIGISWDESIEGQKSLDNWFK
ncbi:MAG: ribonuclease H-like domain-containing protein [Candidatus Heimdallarchaeota archaeon]|nr:ribonuclease H-like domain-containing protein [Candidatus Heimdallarchaeota archaeon]